MRLTKLIVAGSVLMSSASLVWAQQTVTGTVTTIDRIGGTVGLQQTQGGTIGASNGGATEQQFKAPGDLLEKIHAGDKVTVSVTESGGKKTITKIERQ